MFVIPRMFRRLKGRGAPRLAIAVLPALLASTAGAQITKLNAGDPHPSWGSPRINNVGHVALVRGITSSYSGGAWLWTGSWGALAPYAGSAVERWSSRNMPPMALNDLDRIGTCDGNTKTHLFGLGGEISLGTEPTRLDYVIDLNNANQIAAYSWNSNSHRIYAADDPYAAYTAAVQASGIDTRCVVINDSGQIAYRLLGTMTLYRYTPGSGSASVGASNHTSFDMDDAGLIIHLRDSNKVMLDDMILRSSGDVELGGEHGAVAVSDNGRYVAWTENAGPQWSGWNLWTLLDGIPTNLTLGAYGTVYNPDVNNEGKIVFAGANPDQLWSSPYGSDVFLYTPSGSKPAVYNGHFNGNTLFGWVPSVQGAASVTLVPLAAGDFGVQLTAGSPAAIEQQLDLVAGTTRLGLDIDFQSAAGALTLSVDGVTLATLTPADDTQAGFTRVERDATLGDMSLLRLSFDGPAGAAIRIDNITLVRPACPSDLDDGTGNGTPDGGVDINDLLYFLAHYEAGTPQADLDDGSATGTPDGGVDISDLLYFLLRYEAGC